MAEGGIAVKYTEAILKLQRFYARQVGEPFGEMSQLGQLTALQICQEQRIVRSPLGALRTNLEKQQVVAAEVGAGKTNLRPQRTQCSETKDCYQQAPLQNRLFAPPTVVYSAESMLS